MSAVAPLSSPLSTLFSWLLGACAWASRIGVYLLPVYYVAFFVTLFLLWREPQATFWLITAAGALGWVMASWALVFCLASWRRADAPAHAAHAAPSIAPPVRFVQAHTHASRGVFAQSCSDTGAFSATALQARANDASIAARQKANPT
jgi:hypothetical protein